VLPGLAVSKGWQTSTERSASSAREAPRHVWDTGQSAIRSRCGNSHVEWSVQLTKVQVGRHVPLSHIVIDRGCRIPDGMVIRSVSHADAQRFFRTDGGITLVTIEMLARLIA
jgi:hypothetical protein